MRTRPFGLLIGLLVATLIAAVGYLGILTVQSHNRSARATAHRGAEHALAALSLPAGVQAGLAPGGLQISCNTDADTLCLHSTAAPNVAGPSFDQTINATHDDCKSWNGTVGACVVTGSLNGVRVEVVASRHTYRSPNGHIPTGALAGPGNHVYFRGSDILVELAQP